MKLKTLSLAFVGLALLPMSSSGAIVLASDFDANTGSVSGSITGGSPALAVTYSGAEAVTGLPSPLAAAAPVSGNPPTPNGFVSGVGNATTDVATIGNNMNSGDRTIPRGYTFTLTPTATYNLTDVVVIAGHLSGSGTNQGYLSDINFSITTGATPVATPANQVVYADDPTGPVDGFPAVGQLPFTFDLSGITLDAGTTYTFSVNQNNLQTGGAYATYDGFTLNGAVVAAPEPGAALLASLAGLGMLVRRRRK